MKKEADWSNWGDKNIGVAGGTYSIPVAQDGQPLCQANAKVDYDT